MSINFFLLIVISGAIVLPCVDALSSVIMRKMKGVHENTIACYVNPSMMFIMLFMIILSGHTNNLTLILFGDDITWKDYLLYFIFGFTAMIF